MSPFFNRNLGFPSRMARGVLGTLLLIAGIILADYHWWIGLTLVGLGLFALVEAGRGWCLARACWVRTKRGRPAITPDSTSGANTSDRLVQTSLR